MASRQASSVSDAKRTGSFGVIGYVTGTTAVRLGGEKTRERTPAMPSLIWTHDPQLHHLISYINTLFATAAYIMRVMYRGHYFQLYQIVFLFFFNQFAVIGLYNYYIHIQIMYVPPLLHTQWMVTFYTSVKYRVVNECIMRRALITLYWLWRQMTNILYKRLCVMYMDVVT